MKKLALISIITATAALSSGCSIFPSARKVWEQNWNVAGVVERYPKSFNPVRAGTLHVRTDEMWYRRNYSGGQTKLLWGLFTITDY